MYVYRYIYIDIYIKYIYIYTYIYIYVCIYTNKLCYENRVLFGGFISTVAYSLIQRKSLEKWQ